MLRGEMPVAVEFSDLRTTRFNSSGKSGRFYQGEFIAVMGRSGAGKTTLLKMLAGYDGATKGELEFFGKYNWTRNEDLLKRNIGFVSQDNALFQELTPREMLRFYSKVAKRKQVKKTLDLLNLQSCKNTPAKYLSGGEKKRVSIAIELIRNPSILILDEPDSGLDRQSREELYAILFEINSMGTTVIFTTHYDMNGRLRQPRSLEEKEVVFVEVRNERGRGSQETRKISRKGTTTPFGALLAREFKLQKPKTGWFLLAATIAMLIQRAVVTIEDFQRFVDALPAQLILSTVSIILGIMLTINMVCDTYNVTKRDIRMGLSSGKIVLAKILWACFMCVVMSAILVIPYLSDMTSFGIRDEYFHTGFLYGGVFGAMFTSASVALLVSVVLRNSPKKVLAPVVTIIGYQLAFSGFISSNIPSSLRNTFEYLTISKHAIRAIGTGFGFYHPDHLWDTPLFAFELSSEHAIRIAIFLSVFSILAIIIAGFWLAIANYLGIE